MMFVVVKFAVVASSAYEGAVAVPCLPSTKLSLVLLLLFVSPILLCYESSRGQQDQWNQANVKRKTRYKATKEILEVPNKRNKKWNKAHRHGRTKITANHTEWTDRRKSVARDSIRATHFQSFGGKLVCSPRFLSG